MPAPQGETRRVVGLALLGGAGLLAVGAVLIGFGIVPLGEDVRLIAAVVLAVVAGVDAAIGVWFLTRH